MMPVLIRRELARSRFLLCMCAGAVASLPLASVPLPPEDGPSYNAASASQFAVGDSRGSYVYAQACACCHGTDGSGQQPYVPPLRGSSWLAQSSDAALAAVLLHGISGPLNPMQPVNRVMPALGLWLDDGQIAAAATFARTEFAGNPMALQPSTVGAVRTWADRRGTPWTWAELSAALRKSPPATPAPHAVQWAKQGGAPP